MPASTSDSSVVCTACGCVYAFPPGANTLGCPQCSGLSWVSARLAIRSEQQRELTRRGVDGPRPR